MLITRELQSPRPGMKAPPRPLSQKRVAEGLLERVRRARLYALWQAAGAARRPAHLPLSTTGLLRDCQDLKTKISLILGTQKRRNPVDLAPLFLVSIPSHRRL
jgi:hypothetical protein